MGSHAPVKGKSGDRNPVEPPNYCPGAGHRKSLQDIPAEFESQTDNQSSRSPIGRGGRLRPYSVLVRIQPGVPIRGMLKGKRLSLARRVSARSVTAILHQLLRPSSKGKDTRLSSAECWVQVPLVVPCVTSFDSEVRAVTPEERGASPR